MAEGWKERITGIQKTLKTMMSRAYTRRAATHKTLKDGFIDAPEPGTIREMDLLDAAVLELATEMLGGEIPTTLLRPIKAHLQDGYVPSEEAESDENAYLDAFIDALKRLDGFLGYLLSFGELQRPLEAIWADTDRVSLFLRYIERYDQIQDSRLHEPAAPGTLSSQYVSEEAIRKTHSVFLSYGSPDHKFAEKLNESLTRLGIKTFFFPVSAKPGTKLHSVMRDGINANDRVILICSEHSLNRNGVLNEIEETLQREAREGGRAILIPVTLDRYIFDSWQPGRGGLALTLRDRVIADFQGTLENPLAFDTALRKLFEVLVFTDDERALAGLPGSGNKELSGQDLATNEMDGEAESLIESETAPMDEHLVDRAIPLAITDLSEDFVCARRALEAGWSSVAFRTFRRLALRNYPPAQMRLGEMYKNGEFCQRNPELAAKWFMVAAHNGDPDAQYELAEAFQSGHGVQINNLEAGRLYKSAAAKGSARAEFALAEWHYKRGEYDVAFKLFENCERFYDYECAAIRYMRTMYSRGLGVEKNERRAHSLWKEGGSRGCWDAGTDG